MANGRQKTSDEFILEANKVHNNFYDYCKVIYQKDKIKVKIICPIHGEFEQTPGSHLFGRGCSNCSIAKRKLKRSSTSDNFITKAKLIHDNKYDYSLVEYINNQTKIKIICPIHGEFEQQPNNHLMGKSCVKCANESSSWSRTKFIKTAENKICTYYILKCFNDTEVFYKIGITMNTIKQRYQLNKKGDKNFRLPYSHEIIREVKGDASEIWDLELKEKRRLFNINYQPLIPFQGSKTECFKCI